MIESDVQTGAAGFAAAAAWVAKWAPSRPAVPIQGGVRIVVSSGALAMEAYGETVTARVTVDLNGPGSDAPQTAVVSARLLAAVAGTLGKRGAVTIGAGPDGSVQVTQGRAVLTLPPMDADEFATLPAVLETIGELSGDTLAAVVRRCGIAARGTDKVPVLESLYLGFSNDGMEVKAASMARSAIASVPWSVTPAEAAPDGIPPQLPYFATPLSSVMVEAAASFAGPDLVAVGCDGKLLSLANSSRALTVRLFLGEWPIGMVRKITARENPYAVTFQRGDAVLPLQRAELYREKEGYSRLTIAEDEITVEGGAGKGSGSDDGFPCGGYAGESVTIGINPQYLTEALTSAPGDTIRAAFGTPSEPIMLTCQDDPTWLHMLMPIRIR